jgi:class 3 adenylate cyclase
MHCAAKLERREATPRELRKTVTVLFCDMAGSTPMGERLDPEAVRSVLSRFFDEMQAVLERHGGTVETFIGDAVMAVFGVPVVHEEDRSPSAPASTPAWWSPGIRRRGRRSWSATP